MICNDRANVSPVVRRKGRVHKKSSFSSASRAQEKRIFLLCNVWKGRRDQGLGSLVFQVPGYQGLKMDIEGGSVCNEDVERSCRVAQRPPGVSPWSLWIHVWVRGLMVNNMVGYTAFSSAWGGETSVSANLRRSMPDGLGVSLYLLPHSGLDHNRFYWRDLLCLDGAKVLFEGWKYQKS